MEVVLVQGHAHQGMVDFLHDGVGVLEAVDGHGGAAAELQGQLDTVGLYLLHHFTQDGHGVRLDVVQSGLDGQVHGGYYHDHLAVQDLAAADDLIQLGHDGVLFRLGLLHVKTDKGVVGQHLQLVGAEETAQFLQCVLAGRQIAVQALGLYVDVVEAVLFTQGQVFQNGVVFAETIAAFVKTDFHDRILLLQSECSERLSQPLVLKQAARRACTCDFNIRPPK